jgi:prolyl-tRNA synthetase
VVKDDAEVAAASLALLAELRDRGVRARLDDRTDQGFGRRSTDWELKGVPVRIEVGPRDLASGNVTVVRRDGADKVPVSIGEAAGRVADLLETIHVDLLARAIERRDAAITDVTSLDEAAEASTTGWARLPWSAMGDDGEARLAQDGVTVRALQRADGTVPDTGDEPDLVAYTARAY